MANYDDKRKLKFDKKTGKLSLLEVPKNTVMYYYQFIKLLTELEDRNYTLVTERKRQVKAKKRYGGSSTGVYKTSGYILKDKVKINKSAFEDIDLDWIRKQPKILNMKEDVFASLTNNTSKSKKYFQKSSFKFFDMHRHLFETHVSNIVQSPDELDDDNFFSIKIPKHISNSSIAIRNQIDLLLKHNKFEGESSLHKFEKKLADKDFDRYFRGFILREIYDMSYKDLLGALGYTHNANSEGRTTLKSSQRCVMKCKHLLYNLMTENVFPKTTLD